MEKMYLSSHNKKKYSVIETIHPSSLLFVSYKLGVTANC